jgi:hypothetical protein
MEVGAESSVCVTIVTQLLAPSDIRLYNPLAVVKHPEGVFPANEHGDWPPMTKAKWARRRVAGGQLPGRFECSRFVGWLAEVLSNRCPVLTDLNTLGFRPIAEMWTREMTHHCGEKKDASSKCRGRWPLQSAYYTYGGDH